MKLFNRKKETFEPDRWLVRVRGGAATVNGQEMVGFQADRIVRAPTGNQASEVARVEFLEELRVGEVVFVEDEVKSLFAMPVPNDKPAPKEGPIHFWKEEESFEAFFDEVMEWLESNNVKAIREGDRIRVPSLYSDQYEVMLDWDGNEFTVEADPWHTHFHDPDEARMCFTMLLTPFYRVVFETREGKSLGSWIEVYGKRGWEMYSPMLSREVLELVDLGGPYHLTVMQQNILRPPQPQKILGKMKLDSRGDPVGSEFGVFKHQRETSRIDELGILEGLRARPGF